MFKHIILFKSKKPKAVKGICQHVKDLKHEISGLLDVVYIENITDYAKGYNQMAIMDFRDRKAFSNWSKHSYHKKAAQQLKEISHTIFFGHEC